MATATRKPVRRVNRKAAKSNAVGPAKSTEQVFTVVVLPDTIKSLIRSWLGKPLTLDAAIEQAENYNDMCPADAGHAVAIAMHPDELDDDERR
jgi:hypothetical protein